MILNWPITIGHIIMFFFYAIFGSCVFVPYTKTLLPAIQQLNEKTFAEFKPVNQVLIALILPDSSSAEQQSFMLTIFSSVIPFYSNMASFAFFRASEAPSLADSIPTAPPAIVFFFQGNLMFSCPLPMSETTLSLLVASWVDPEYDISNSKEELFSALGGVPLALLTKERFGMQANLFVTSSLSFIGSCIVLRVSDQLFSEITENAQHCSFAMYRYSDRTIVPIPDIILPNGTVNQGNITQDALYNSTRPFNGVLTSSILASRPELYACFVNDSFNPTANDKVLYKLGEKHYKSDFRFVSATPETFPLISQITRSNITAPDFFVFSYTYGFYYPHDGLLTGIDMEDPRWFDLADAYIQKILNGTIPRKYFSEPETDEMHGKYLKKLVGTTFKDFVEDPTKDVVVVFHDGDERATADLEALSSVLNDDVCKNIKFGYINIDINSSPLRYPICFDTTTVFLFPAKNKTDVRVMFSPMIQDSVLRFLNQSTTLEHDFEVPPTDEMTAQMELFMFSMRSKRVPPIYREQAIQYVKNLQEIAYSVIHHGKIPFNENPAHDKPASEKPASEKPYNEL
ncbi:hypothetical protein TRFO_33874 [Tritrichomonas foetus]|uniref:Thioredoxin domain-containing protein n=1 Tax=Tritrichomonas foetus TaxID=1144522 RepID=A0A1J4JQ05_9EUKA|nr:hypothetical protein TRFO_33874 [Tritrichomonas foetus]|eukprot:OHS99613.1 hypothetical protein TRFO_33874 [Tritrichomonas foetus]